MSTDTLEPPRAEPDFAAMDDLAEFAITHADELAALGRWIRPQPTPGDKA